MTERYAIGIDFGTLSGRALVARVSDGAELASAVTHYRHGVIERALPATGTRLPPDWALQVPEDYIEVLRTAVPEAVRRAGIAPDSVLGIGIDFTSSTPLPVLADGTPLSELAEFAGRPHAYVKLWKHHAASEQAQRITRLAEERAEPWLRRYGGAISSEGQFAKGLQILEEDPEVYARMDRFVEAADWIVWRLTGRYVRSAGTAGYKGLLQDGEAPDEEYLAALHPGFAGFAAEKLAGPIGRLGDAAGTLAAEAARWTGLPEGIPVAVANIDAHVTVPAAKSTDPGQLVLVMGTSTCQLMNAQTLLHVQGVCGVVDGGITPGLFGYEAGQSGVGDIFAWFVDNAVPGRYTDEAAALGISVHEHLANLAADEPVGAHGLVALDWWSGNRSVLVDHQLSGLVLGMTLTTRAEDVYRALVEATAFGTRRIVESFAEAGIPVREVIVAGGLLKNAALMQTYSDVLRMPLSVLTSEHGSALGSAIHAAVAAGAYPDVRAASEAMGRVERGRHQPDPARADAYDALYAEYLSLHDYFGRGGNPVMHRLKRIKREAHA
jgi:L-ribulokinase